MGEPGGRGPKPNPIPEPVAPVVPASALAGDLAPEDAPDLPVRLRPIETDQGGADDTMVVDLSGPLPEDPGRPEGGEPSKLEEAKLTLDELRAALDARRAELMHVQEGRRAQLGAVRDWFERQRERFIGGNEQVAQLDELAAELGELNAQLAQAESDAVGNELLPKILDLAAEAKKEHGIAEPGLEGVLPAELAEAIREGRVELLRDDGETFIAGDDLAGEAANYGAIALDAANDLDQAPAPYGEEEQPLSEITFVMPVESMPVAELPTALRQRPVSPDAANAPAAEAKPTKPSEADTANMPISAVTTEKKIQAVPSPKFPVEAKPGQESKLPEAEADRRRQLFDLAHGLTKGTREQRARLANSLAGQEVSISGRQFQVERVLGHGGLGFALEVADPKSGEKKVLKITAPFNNSELMSGTGGAAAKRQLLEVAAQSRLTKAAKADGLAPEDRPFASMDKAQFLPHPDNADWRMNLLLMEKVEGQDLRAEWEMERNVDKVMEMAIQCLEAIQYMHDKGVVHRDIKPGNFMRTPEGKVKLIDFGLAMVPSFIEEKRTRFRQIEVGQDTILEEGFKPSEKFPLQASSKTTEGETVTTAPAAYGLPDVGESISGSPKFMPKFEFDPEVLTAVLVTAAGPEALAGDVKHLGMKRDKFAPGVMLFEKALDLEQSTSLSPDDREKLRVLTMVGARLFTENNRIRGEGSDLTAGSAAELLKRAAEESVQDAADSREAMETVALAKAQHKEQMRIVRLLTRQSS